MPSIEIIQESEQWSQYRNEWNAMAVDRITRSYEWMRAWWDAYQSDYRLFILRASEEGRTIGFFPLVRHQTLAHGETISWMGSGKACSDDVGILAEQPNEKIAATSFAEFFQPSNEHSIYWDHMDLDGVRPSDAPIGYFLEHLQAISKVKVERRPSLNCWRFDAKDGWDKYLESLSKRVRKMWNDTAGYLEGESKFQLAESLEESIHLAKKIEKLHQSRWEKRGIVGCFGTAHFEDFLSNTLKAMWETRGPNSRPFVSLITIHDQPASGMVGYIYENTLYIYLTGMDPSFLPYRPGWQTSFCSIQAALGMGCTSIDFMRGDEDYKPRLGALPIQQERWIIASPRLISQIRNSAYYTAIGLRNWAQSWRAPSNAQ